MARHRNSKQRDKASALSGRFDDLGASHRKDVQRSEAHRNATQRAAKLFGLATGNSGFPEPFWFKRRATQSMAMQRTAEQSKAKHRKAYR
jgi:hypothetical protein